MSEKTVSVKHCANFSAENVSCSGRADIPVFRETFNSDGVYTVIEDGSYNIQELINSFKDDTDIYTILRRVANGESEALDRKRGFYFDMTGLPDNMIDAHKVMVEAQSFFNELPSDIRLQYNNNFRQFIADYGSERFLSIFSPEAPSPVPESVSNNSIAEGVE